MPIPGMRQHKFTRIVVIKIFAINLCHHNHFLATLFDFTTFFTLAILNKVTPFLNQARATASCGRALGFLKLFYEKCVCVYACMYVCMYVYLFVFSHPHEQTFYLKLESSLYTNNKG